jgi:hypothetical protein
VNACFQQPNILGPPTLAGYSAFLYNTVGVPTAALPADSFNINLSFALAMDIVSTWLQCMQSDVYTIAVYNLATDRLINFCPDQPGQSYFTNLRANFSINMFVAGVVQTANDQGTGDGMLVPDFMKGLTMMDLANLNTPYGRQYLALAQTVGGVWGLN